MFEEQKRMCFIKEADPINFVIFTEKHLCWSLFNKVAGLKACNVIDKRLQYRCFPVGFAKFLRHLFEDYLRAAASESKAEFVQSMQIVQSVAKTYW